MLTDIQRRALKVLAQGRTVESYAAGGAVLNRDWPRLSDDIDIFHDTDEDIVDFAHKDIAALREAGFSVVVDIEAYGIVEARVGRGGSESMIQWMSESRRRFFPLVVDPEWGYRLHMADLAVNKVLAASARTKARDFADLLAIQISYAPLGPIIMAAAGKPPYLSPVKTIEEIRRRLRGIGNEGFLSVYGLPEAWTPAFIRENLAEALDAAEDYAMSAPPDLVGLLLTDEAGAPVAYRDRAEGPTVTRKASELLDAVPEAYSNEVSDWTAEAATSGQEPERR